MKRIVVILLAGLMIIGLAACATTPTGTSTEPSTAASTGTSAEVSTGTSASTSDKLAPADQLYIFVNCNTASETSSYHKLGFDAAVAELGVRGEYTGPTDGDEAVQVNALELAITQNPQGIIVHPCGEAPLAIIDKAVEAGIPVVIVDNALPGSKAMCYLTTGNEASGEVGGKRLVEELNGEGQVAFLYWVTATNLCDVVQGYKNIIDDYPGIEIVAEQNCLYDAIEASNAAAALMQAYPDLDAIVVVDGNSGAGVATAVKEAGKIGQVKVFARDFDKATLQGIKDGIITCTLGQKQALMGYEGLKILFTNYNSADALNYMDGMGIVAMPTYIDTGSLFIDSINVDAFMANLLSNKE